MPIVIKFNLLTVPILKFSQLEAKIAPAMINKTQPKILMMVTPLLCEAVVAQNLLSISHPPNRIMKKTTVTIHPMIKT
jgi:hypothetical protein